MCSISPPILAHIIDATMQSSVDDPSGLVVVDYNDIASSTADLSVQLERAFGGSQPQSQSSSSSSSSSFSPLGIIAIRNVPDFVRARDEFLDKAHSLAHLESEYLETRLSDPMSMYNAGW